MHIEPATKLG